MVTLLTQRDLQEVQKLAFCYLCGKDFLDGDVINRDHIPPQSAFAKKDRQPLWLPTHPKCNSAHQLNDEKIGQLIALKYGKFPAANRWRVNFIVAPTLDKAAVANLNIDQAIWRWIAGFHAALYKECALGSRGSLASPFPRGDIVDGKLQLRELLQQHAAFVVTIKENRARGNLDKISANNGKLTYECVWYQDDKKQIWMCIFALDIYDWKDLGKTNMAPTRGCAGFYVLPSKDVPEKASKGTISKILIPNYDVLDPFSK